MDELKTYKETIPTDARFWSDRRLDRVQLLFREFIQNAKNYGGTHLLFSINSINSINSQRIFRIFSNENHLQLRQNYANVS